MAIPPFSGKPQSDYPGKNLLTGDSTQFSSSTGSWSSYGLNATVTRENGSNSGFPYGSGNNLKLVTTRGNGLSGFGVPNNGVSARVTKPGGFKSGQTYIVKFYAAYENDPFSGNTFLNAVIQPNTGAISQSNSLGPYVYGSSAPYGWQEVQFGWAVVGDCSYADIIIGRFDSSATAQTYHVAGDSGGPIFKLVDGFPSLRPQTGGRAFITGDLHLQHNEVDGVGGSHSPDLQFSRNGIVIDGQGSSLLDSSNLFVGKGYASIDVPHATSGDLIDNGFNLEAGQDYVGLFVSEMDANTLQFYADWSSGYMMQLRNRGTAKGWSASDDGVTNARIESFFQWERTISGTLATGTDLCAHFQTPQHAKIDEVRVHVGTAPTGATLIVDVNDDGTTVFTTQANRPTIAISGTDATSGAADGGDLVTQNSVITVDIDQVGSTIAGSDLTVFIRGRYIW